jgi:DNA repair exonuclease SbcCD ATPase subunit
MVMVKALPIINVRLSRLLEDVCDFDVQIEINSSNEVEFVMIQDGIKSSLYSHGSGFEKTAAALALRCVLAEVSTISKCNFVIIDEILGRIAKENFDNMRALYQRIAKNYDFIFQITHNEEVKEWHDTIVTVEKEGRISRIKVNK